MAWVFSCQPVGFSKSCNDLEEPGSAKMYQCIIRNVSAIPADILIPGPEVVPSKPYPLIRIGVPVDSCFMFQNMIASPSGALRWLFAGKQRKNYSVQREIHCSRQDYFIGGFEYKTQFTKPKYQGCKVYVNNSRNVNARLCRYGTLRVLYSLAKRKQEKRRTTTNRRLRRTWF